MNGDLVLLAYLLQLRERSLALRQPLLQADDLVLQTFVQRLLVFDRLCFDLQLLELSSRQKLSDLALDENDSVKTSLVFLALQPAPEVSLDDDSLRVPQKLQVTLAGKVTTDPGLQQNGAILVASGKEIKRNENQMKSR